MLEKKIKKKFFNIEMRWIRVSESMKYEIILELELNDNNTTKIKKRNNNLLDQISQLAKKPFTKMKRPLLQEKLDL